MTNNSSPDTTSRRRHKRYTTSLHVAVANHYSLLFERAVQISRGGLLLQTSNLPILNQTIELRFFLPNKDFIFVKGEIVYRLKVDGQYYAGVRFLTSSPELNSWIDTQAGGASDENLIGDH